MGAALEGRRPERAEGKERKANLLLLYVPWLNSWGLHWILQAKHIILCALISLLKLLGVFIKILGRRLSLFIPSGCGASSSDLKWIRCCLKCLCQIRMLCGEWTHFCKEKPKIRSRSFIAHLFPCLETYIPSRRESSCVAMEMNLAPGGGAGGPRNAALLLRTGIWRKSRRWLCEAQLLILGKDIPG